MNAPLVSSLNQPKSVQIETGLLKSVYTLPTTTSIINCVECGEKYRETRLNIKTICGDEFCFIHCVKFEIVLFSQTKVSTLIDFPIIFFNLIKAQGKLLLNLIISCNFIKVAFDENKLSGQLKQRAIGFMRWQNFCSCFSLNVAELSLE